MNPEVAAPAGDRRALWLLVSKRPRNVGWRQAAGLLFGDWGTSRLYVLGLAFFFAPQSSLWLLIAMSLLVSLTFFAYNVGDKVNRRLEMQGAADSVAITGAEIEACYLRG